MTTLTTPPSHLAPPPVLPLENGDRLTRIELNLDVRPAELAEAASLAVHLAVRHVEAERRRFKAEVELLNPDIYEELVGATNGTGSGNASRG